MAMNSVEASFVDMTFSTTNGSVCCRAPLLQSNLVSRNPQPATANILARSSLGVTRKLRKLDGLTGSTTSCESQTPEWQKNVLISLIFHAICNFSHHLFSLRAEI